MEKIIQDFNNISVQTRKDEVWRSVDFSALLNDDYRLSQGTAPLSQEPHCNIQGLTAHRLMLVDGYCQMPLTVMPNGVIMGGLRAAAQQYPDLVAQCHSRFPKQDNAYLQFNSQHYTDGVFLYIPNGVQMDMPVQILSAVAAEHPVFVQSRNVVFVGEGSYVQLIHCDDSLNHYGSMSSNVTEIYASRDAQVEYYKMQNLNDKTGLLNQNFVRMEQGSSFRSVSATLNGGIIRNHAVISMLGEHCEVQAHGLYLNDKSQQVDNYIFVDHAMPNCNSEELFKGILDDSARARFNGHVLVRDGATKTQAYQSNKNILMTDKAFVETKPFLEIYNDDVKCSHGSTIGQIDEQALFYIRTRGVPERVARVLLLYAFCDEVIQKIQLASLRESLSDMVKKRLHGELSACSDCALHCSTPCNGPEVNFKIDKSKL